MSYSKMEMAMPVKKREITLPGGLPAMVADLFSAEIKADSHYWDFMKQLRQAGVVAVGNGTTRNDILKNWEWRAMTGDAIFSLQDGKLINGPGAYKQAVKAAYIRAAFFDQKATAKLIQSEVEELTHDNSCWVDAYLSEDCLILMDPKAFRDMIQSDDAGRFYKKGPVTPACFAKHIRIILNDGNDVMVKKAAHQAEILLRHIFLRSVSAGKPMPLEFFGDLALDGVKMRDMAPVGA